MRAMRVISIIQKFPYAGAKGLNSWIHRTINQNSFDKTAVNFIHELISNSKKNKNTSLRSMVKYTSFIPQLLTYNKGFTVKFSC